MKTFLVVLASLSLLLNAYLVIRGFDASVGGGMYKQSPDMKHTVMIDSIKSFNPISAEKRVYAEITLHNGFIADERIRTFTVSPISESNEMAYRELKDPIQWSDDSQKATVTTPDFTISINLRPQPAEPQNAAEQPIIHLQSESK